MPKVLPANPLHSAIVEILTEKPSLNMKDLHQILEEQYDFEFTPQYLYQVVGRLLEWEVLMKTKQKVSLNVRWLSTLKQTVDAAMSTLREDLETSKNFVLQEGKKKEFIVSSASAPAIWTNAVLCAFEETGATDYYEFLGHPYWILVSKQISIEHLKSILDQEVQFHTLIGGQTFLDKKGIQMYKDRQLQVSVATDTSFYPDGYSVAVVGDYVIEFMLPDRVTQSLSLLYETVTSDDKFNQKFYQDILHIQESCSLTITRSSKRAEEVRAEMQKYIS